MKYFIGVEGIGMRWSAAVAAHENGQVIGAVRGAPLALHTQNRAELRTRLNSLIGKLRTVANISDLSKSDICIGLTGVTFPYDAKIVLPNEFGKTQLKFEKL